MPFGMELVLQILLAIHAARTGRTQPWLYIILFIPLIGPLLYVVVELGPEFFRGYAGQRMATGVVKTLAPDRDYRALARQVEIAPTVYNKMHLVDECLRLGRAEEAVGLYQTCAIGMHADDPALRIGLARAYFAAGNPAAAVTELDALRAGPAEARTADGHLLYAQALDATGMTDAALTEYQALAEYFPGEEARCRYAELLERTGATELGRA